MQAGGFAALHIKSRSFSLSDWLRVMSSSTFSQVVLCMLLCMLPSEWLVACQERLVGLSWSVCRVRLE